MSSSPIDDKKRRNNIDGAHSKIAAHPAIIIRPRKSIDTSDLLEILQFRTVIYFLIWRDFKVRYRQTFLGLLWAILQPLASMVVFSLVFSRLAGISSDGVPYSVFVLAGLLPWGYFSHALASASSSLTNNRDLLKRVYFPRLIIPMAAILSCVTDLLTSLGLLLLVMFALGVPVSLNIVFLPFFLLIAIAAALGAGAALAAAHVRYRDVGYITPFAIQILLFLTPVVYPSSLIPASWRLVYGLNPMAGVVEGVRWCMLNIPPHPEMIVVSAISTLAILLGGLYYFQRSERIFADIV
ncbi:ABC transporter permease [Microvirga sp. BSC39]|uniref:ABC transporter permease n=1 Tax=Microvirga sp. BSC39 TaxID=1549810 RepID=UPI0013633A3B|nr:ABC transporter permease [Microvirga sp. BSC39]